MNMNLYPNKMHTVRQILTLCATAFLTLGIASCDSNSIFQLPPAEGSASLTLRIETPVATRVDNVTDEEYASFENRISTLRLLVLSESGSVLKTNHLRQKNLQQHRASTPIPSAGCLWEK